MAESENVVVRLYQPGDEIGIAELLQTTFEVWPKIESSVSAEQHMLWKLSSDPDSKRFQVLAVASDKIVGCRLFFFNWFRIQGKRLCCRQGFDLAIHPDFQGQGILNDMWFYARKHFDDENDFNFGVGAHPAALHMRVAQGNITIENKVQVLVHQLAGGLEPAPDHDFKVSVVQSFDERADVLFEQASCQFDFIRERTAAFLNWRHADPRSGNFVTLQADSGSALLGYIVLSSAGKTGQIADVLTLPDRSDVVEGLVRSAVAHLVDLGMSSIDCWVPTEHPYRAVLVRNGFTHKKRVIPLSYRHLRTPAEQLAFLTDPHAKLHIMANDTDLV